MMLLQHIENSFIGVIDSLRTLAYSMPKYPLSYVVVLSFIYCFTTFYHLDPYLSIQLYNLYDCSIRVTAVLEYLKLFIEHDVHTPLFI